MRASASPASWPACALLAVALGQQHAELGRDRDHQRAERDRHRVQRDPRREQHERRPAGRQRDRDQRHERARGAAQDRAAAPARPPPARRAASAARRGEDDSAALASAASTGRPASSALHARRRVQLRAHLVDHLLLARRAASGGCRTPASPSSRSGVITPWEKYGGTASSSALIALVSASCRVVAPAPGEEVGQRERRAQRRRLRAAACVSL